MTRAFLMLSLLLCACGGGSDEVSEAPRNAPVRVIAEPVRYAADDEAVEAVGTARAQATAVIRPETGGEVEEVSFRTGDEVEAGQPLLRLESAAEELAVRLARVSVAEAEQLLERYRRIEGTGAVSDSAIDEARTALEAARIDLETAELALERRIVRAPFAGTVGLTDVDPGARITPETEITRLDDRSMLFVDFPVPEQVFGRLGAGDEVRVEPFNAGGARAAEIVGIDSQVDPATRSFTARAAIPNEDDAFRPGMSFRVAFDVEGRAYPVIPEAAIVWGGDGAYLWAVREGKARRVPAAIVSRREGEVLVNADLPEGSLIVAEGVQKVREGGVVEGEGVTRARPVSTGGASVSGSR